MASVGAARAAAALLWLAHAVAVDVSVFRGLPAVETWAMCTCLLVSFAVIAWNLWRTSPDGGGW